MRNSKSEYTSTCDRCGQTKTDSNSYPPLMSIYLDDIRPGSYRSADPHRHFMDLCEECFDGLIKYLHADDRLDKLKQESKGYVSYQ